MLTNELNKVQAQSSEPVEKLDHGRSEESSDKFEGGIEPEHFKGEAQKISALICSPVAIKEIDLGSPDYTPTKGVNSLTSASKSLDGSPSTKLADTPSTASSTKSGISRSLSRKSTIIIEPAKEHKKSYILAGLTSISFGLANYYYSDLSIRCGNKAIYTQCVGSIFTWALFHLHKFISFKRNPKSVGSYFRKSNSPYLEEFYEFLEDVEEDEENAAQQKPQKDIDSLSIKSEIDEQNPKEPSKKRLPDLQINVAPISTKQAPISHYKFTWQRFSAPVARTFAYLSNMYFLQYCFEFAYKSGVNSGIISSIFSSSCIFTTMVFYFKYGHKISVIDAIGIGFILLCVFMIALGGAGGSFEEDDIKSDDQIKEQKLNLVLALLFAILVGLSGTLNTLACQYTTHTGFDLDQATQDCNGMVGLLLLPFCIYYRETYTLGDYVVSTISNLFITLGLILYTRALSSGSAGPVQAIENSKTVVQTVMAIICLGQIPNTMQILGLVAGSVGVLVIVSQKQKDVAAKEIDTEAKK